MERLSDTVDYVHSLSRAESLRYFSKEGQRERSGRLNFADDDSWPHDLARFLFWDFVAKDAVEEQDKRQFITEELQAKVCREAAMVELWIAAVEPHIAPLTPEQRAHFCEMSPPAQELALNVLAGLQVRNYGERLARHFGGLKEMRLGPSSTAFESFLDRCMRKQPRRRDFGRPRRR